MNAIKIKVDWTLLGLKFSNLSAKKQAEFFKGLSEGLKSYITNIHKELQFFAVGRKLSENDKKELEKTLSCLWSKKE